MTNVNAALREAYIAKKRAENDRLINLVLDSQHLPSQKVVGGRLELATPVDFELEHRGKFRLFRVDVYAYRSLCKRNINPGENDSPILEEAFGVVQPLNADDTPHKRKGREKVELPLELVNQLLGRLDTAP